jgi:hypothetical protein
MGLFKSQRLSETLIDPGLVAVKRKYQLFVKITASPY